MKILVTCENCRGEFSYASASANNIPAFMPCCLCHKPTRCMQFKMLEMPDQLTPDRKPAVTDITEIDTSVRTMIHDYQPKTGHAELIDLHTQRTYPLPEIKEMIVGRFVEGNSKQPDVRLYTEDHYISKLHFAIGRNFNNRTGEYQFLLKDHSSTNKTYLEVNGEKIPVNQDYIPVLKDGNVIRVGRSDLLFKLR